MKTYRARDNEIVDEAGNQVVVILRTNCSAKTAALIAAAGALDATKAKRLAAMGLIVNRKPNGRPLIVRSHAEAVLSGRAEAAAAATMGPRPTSGDRAAVIALFGRKAA